MICLRAREESCCCVVALRIHYRSNRETLSCDKMWIRRRNILKWCWKGYRSVWMKRQSAVCPKHPPSVRYCGTVWRFVRLHTDPPSTWQMTHFSLGCYFQMVHRDEHGEKWRKWVKKMWGRKVREFRQRRNEGLWYMGRQDRGCVCEPSTPPSSTNPGGNFTFEERIRSERDKNKSHINYSGVRECIWMCVIPESGPVILYGLWWSALGQTGTFLSNILSWVWSLWTAGDVGELHTAFHTHQRHRKAALCWIHSPGCHWGDGVQSWTAGEMTSSSPPFGFDLQMLTVTHTTSECSFVVFVKVEPERWVWQRSSAIQEKLGAEGLILYMERNCGGSESGKGCHQDAGNPWFVQRGGWGWVVVISPRWSGNTPGSSSQLVEVTGFPVWTDTSLRFT